MIRKKIKKSLFFVALVVFALSGLMSSEKASAAAEELVCQGKYFGQDCTINSQGGYCYPNSENKLVCETEDGGNDEWCGVLGGKCKPHYFGVGLGIGEIHDNNGGRDCARLYWCVVSKTNLYVDVCKNKTDGTKCGNRGFCYDEKCDVEEGGRLGYVAEEGERCGTKKDAACIKTPSDNKCPDGFVIDPVQYPGGDDGSLGRKCKNTSDVFPELLCCAVDTGLNFAEPTIKYVECPTSPKEGILGGMKMFSGSIVPCGRKCDDPNTKNINEMDECTLCHFIIMGKRIYDLVFSWLVIVSILMITVGGVLYMLSGANSGWNSLAKEIITKTLIGFALFLGSWLIVYTSLLLLSANTNFLGTGAKWYDFKCETTSHFSPTITGGPTPTADEEAGEEPVVTEGD